VGVHASPVDRDHHRTEARFASGFTRELAGVTGYVMWANVLRWDPRLDDNAGLETGVEGGMLTSGPILRAGLRGRELWGVLGTDRHRRKAEAEVRWSVTRDLFAGLSVSHQRELNHSRNLVRVNFGRTF
jgi:hypothetical protein